MDEKIMTIHPKDKRGVNIARQKYDTIRTAIIKSLKSRRLTHTELIQEVRKHLSYSFDGSVAWYVEAVKQDLEARHEIERFGYGRNKSAYRLISEEPAVL
nr:hypothetical protein [candidate division Zixibacteria bacterium]